MMPGLGLISFGRIKSGVAQLLLALISFIMALAAVVWPMLQDIINLLNDRNDNLQSPDLSAFIVWAVVVIAVWIWSTIEIFICYKPQKEPSKD
jgi:dolichol kinase